MIQFNPEIEFKTYSVTLGHHCVAVQGRNEQEAIVAARRQLSDDMPRLWDVIQTMDASQFAAKIVEK